MSRRQPGIAWLVLGLAFVCVMPSNQSLWIDEGFTVPYAQEGSFSQFLSRLANDSGSEALMPLGMFSTWAGAKVFGRSEVGLRAVSALWAAVAVFLLWRTGILLGFPWLGALLACHPFLWYYAGEVRPYAMVIALSAGLSYALVAVLSPKGNPTRALYTFLSFGPLLCATQVLGLVPFAVVGAVVGVTLFRGRWRPRPWDLAVLVLSGSVVVFLGLYYRKVISAGADINWAGPWRVGLNNLLFSGFELLGFAGLGPGRYELRQRAIETGMRGSLEALSPPTIVGLVVLALLYALILVHYGKRSRPEETEVRRVVLTAGLVIVLIAGITFALCLAVGSTFWGRHLASLLPFLVIAIGIASVTASDPSGRSSHVLSVLLGATLLTSSLLVRFHPDHRRDDYRGAARIALAAVQEGKAVWWAAAEETARYYGMEFCNAARPGVCAVPAINLEPEALEELAAADVILISKPELHDLSGAVRWYIVEHRLQLRSHLLAFEVFEAP